MAIRITHVNECCIRAEKRGIAPHEMADLYAPQGVDLEGGGSPQEKVESHSTKSGLSRKKIVNWHLN